MLDSKCLFIEYQIAFWQTNIVRQTQLNVALHICIYLSQYIFLHLGYTYIHNIIHTLRPSDPAYSKVCRRNFVSTHRSIFEWRN